MCVGTALAMSPSRHTYLAAPVRTVSRDSETTERTAGASREVTRGE